MLTLYRTTYCMPSLAFLILI
uniref:Uncharacterized protein n=1 Tax=Arundo donax TaxID=35708 RepID=A0A0A8YRU0_ARUDO